MNQVRNYELIVTARATNFMEELGFTPEPGVFRHDNVKQCRLYIVIDSEAKNVCSLLNEAGYVGQWKLREAA
jgi:hypothetical protein